MSIDFSTLRNGLLPRVSVEENLPPTRSPGGPSGGPALPPPPNDPPPPGGNSLDAAVGDGDPGGVLGGGRLQDISSIMAQLMHQMVDLGMENQQAAARRTWQMASDVIDTARQAEEKAKKAAMDLLLGAFVELAVQAGIGLASAKVELGAAGNTKSAHDINLRVNAKTKELHTRQKDDAALRQGDMESIDQLKDAQRQMTQPGAFQGKADLHDQKMAERKALETELEQVKADRAKAETGAADAKTKKSEADKAETAARTEVDKAEAELKLATEKYEKAVQERDEAAVAQRKADEDVARLDKDWEAEKKGIDDDLASKGRELADIAGQIEKFKSSREQGKIPPAITDRELELQGRLTGVSQEIKSLENRGYDRGTDYSNKRDAALERSRQAHDDLTAKETVCVQAGAAFEQAQARLAAARAASTTAAATASQASQNEARARENRDSLAAREQQVDGQLTTNAAEMKDLHKYVVLRDDYNAHTKTIDEAQLRLQKFNDESTAAQKEIENEITGLRIQADVYNNKAANANSINRALTPLGGTLGNAAASPLQWQSRTEEAEKEFINQWGAFLATAKDQAAKVADFWLQQIQGTLSTWNEVNRDIAQTTSAAVKG